MMSSTLAILPALLSFASPTVEWEAPLAYVEGRPYPVEITVRADEEGAVVPSWLLTVAAFEMDRTPLGKRPTDTFELAAGAELTVRYDLAPYLDVKGPFSLVCASRFTESQPQKVQAYRLAPVETSGRSPRTRSRATPS